MASRSRMISFGLIGLAIVVVTGLAADAATPQGNVWPYASRHGESGSFTVATVGDIACEPATAENASTPAALKCSNVGATGNTLGGLPAEFATAQQAYAMHPDRVALLGDEQYEVGKLTDFEQSFEQSWGGLKMLERPAPGNHEYYSYTKHKDNEAGQNGTGYFEYFNGHTQAGTPNSQGQAGQDTGASQGWYSYNVGSWHFISLNIECMSQPFNFDCSSTDGGLLNQETSWLASDLASNDQPCTVAYWHQPTFSATTAPSSNLPDPSAPGVGSGEGLAADAWWKLLYDAHATLVLNGHEHVYARFKPMDPSGKFDPKHGITQITVGTGGEDLDTLARTGSSFDNPNVVTGQDQAFGVMKLTLKGNSASWSYQPALAGPLATDPTAAMAYSDSGSVKCQGEDGNSNDK
ncbi:MAG: metallophosphoesterase [Candidatus Dormibacteraeota bacterium]|nr:metallophosphoesterase [Candidatus Dormibacteraeota bacterium]